MAKGLPGYPSNKNLQKQAAALASGAVSTRRSIRRQYALPIQANQGFTEALIHLLQGGGGAVSSGYDQAIQQQQGIGQAAAARLAALGGQYGAGSAAAVGGLGDSALTSLNAQAAASKNYAGQMPAVAASRGQLMNAQLLQQRNQAFQQRNEDYRSALQQALQTVQQNALAMSSLRSSNRNAAADRLLQQQSMAQQNAQFQAQQQFNQQQAAQDQARWAYEHSPGWLKIQAQIQAAANGTGGGGGGGKNPLSQYTPSEIATMQRIGSSAASDYAGGGMPLGKAIDQIVLAKGVARPIAIAEAMNAYAMLKNDKPRLSAFASHDNQQADYNAALRAWKISYNSFRRVSRLKAFNRWLSKQPHYQPTPPGAHGPGK